MQAHGRAYEISIVVYTRERHGYLYTQCISSTIFVKSILFKRFMKRPHKSLKQYGSPLIKILATEIVQASDPRATDPRMTAIKCSEIRDLIRRGTFQVILKQEVPKGANVLTPQFFSLQNRQWTERLSSKPDL